MQKVILLLLLSFTTVAQNVQWANKIIDNASNARNTKGILGYPDAFQLKEVDKDKVWYPDQKSENVGISVGFRAPMQVKEVIIAEKCCIGTITSVQLIDIYGFKVPVYKYQGENTDVNERLWHLKFLQKTDFEVKGIYLEVNPTLSTNYLTQIDAIGISSVDTIVTYEHIKNTKNNFWKDEEKFTTINLPANVPDNVTKQTLGSNINTKETQVGPVLSLDENLLFFTANKKTFNPEKLTYYKRQDVWVSEKDKKGNWVKPTNLNEPINTKDHNAIAGISADSKSIYLLNTYLDNGKLAPGFSVSRFNGQNWEKPTNRGVENFKNFSSYTEFAIGMNEKVIIISYKKDSLISSGYKDLFVSFLKKDGNWSEPKHMGNVINSYKNEGTPFLAYDSKTLYFSSNSFGGYGDNDIYMSKRLDSTWTNWSEPVNLGKGINTPKWDAYFWVAASGDYAFTCSEESPQNEDIFKVNLYPSIKPEPVAILSGKVKNTDGEPILVDISMQEQPKTVFEDYRASNNFEGDYHLIVPVGAKYTLKVIKQGYQTITKEIDLSNFNSLQKIELNFTLEKIK